MVTIFLILAGVLFLWTIFNSMFMPGLKSNNLRRIAPVSILIPLRNEEFNAGPLVESLKKITYPDLEILLLDDHSEDRTFALLSEATADDPRFRLFKGEPLKKGWTGKVFACHQLSRLARGEYMLFLDADVRVSPDIVTKLLALTGQKQASFISGFPSFTDRSLLGRLLVPMQHFVIHMHLPLFMANKTEIPMFTAAFGGCLFIEIEAYEEIGGHTEVFDSLVEDVHLAKKMKENKKRTILANVTSDVSCRMYERNADVWKGFQKNIFPGLGRSLPLALLLVLLYTGLFLFPFAAALITVGSWWGVCLLLVAVKMFVDVRTGHPWWISLLLPVSAISVILVLFSSIKVDRQKKQYEWKGRTYS
ncbi:hypothetical protein AAV35_007815 [Salimicrobium jeotgali]|uniref:Hydroxy-3,4-dehydro-apo-8'-lycopene glucosyltransferase n=1 Tax=Salimicrobium jeotgali TaxID=1230341 RepID=K2G9N4_9BACI|nr:glycosyltransferase [Salimicrobium jeotgali]AKG04716.1 hypothetical protein AAV35_007815 [Salimicrobium jeotgali]EKE31783.1 hydroxy-3,4-dehydro-apo-8'-lycopene glucosyltransferase [Salimicrobium jeotgali]MBM7696255.1 cellulose synthase/poly-beta-1,6-N-acetylglucosamine synthase-like glycosyltransferase [Salimicrobium jeotgali]